MITCDTNILISAAKYHLHLVRGDIQSKSAHMLAMRSRKNFAVVDISLGEILYGTSSEMEIQLAMAMAQRMRVVEATRDDLGMASRLIKLLHRKKSKAKNDCVIYATASRHKITYLASWDDGFVGAKNRIRVPQALFDLGVKTPTMCVTPTEVIIMPHINPKKKLSEAAAFKRDIAAYRRRAWARARGMVGNDTDKIIWLFAQVGRMAARR